MGVQVEEAFAGVTWGFRGECVTGAGIISCMELALNSGVKPGAAGTERSAGAGVGGGFGFPDFSASETLRL